MPYAFKAHEAETLGGKSLSDFVLAKDLDSNSGVVSANSADVTTSSAGKSPMTQAGVKTGAVSVGPTNFSGSTTDQVVGVTQSGTGAGVTTSAVSERVKKPPNTILGRAVSGGSRILVLGTPEASQIEGIPKRSTRKRQMCRN